MIFQNYFFLPLFNPLLPSVAYMRRSGKILILIQEIRIIKKISYERRYYESVDRKDSILGYVPKNYEKGIQAVMSLKKMKIYNFV